MAGAAETLVEERWEGWVFLPIWDVVLEIGAGVRLLAWLWSKRFVRVWERVWG